MKSPWVALVAVRLASATPFILHGPTLPPPAPLPPASKERKTPIPSDLLVGDPIDKAHLTKGATFTTTKHGPYHVEAMGSLHSSWDLNMAMPCTECYITAMQANLVYEDGSPANIDTGAWMHHIVVANGMTNTPPAEIDLVCGKENAGKRYPNRIFAAGNERTPIRFNGRYKYGLKVNKGDKFAIMSHLVNQSMKNQTYYITINYEWVPKSTPGYNPARSIWMDVTGCGGSDVDAQEGYYELKSPPWKSTIGGKMLITAGHEHDGGTFTSLYINDKPMCTSYMLYGTQDGFIEKGDIVNLNSGAGRAGKDDAYMQHISQVSLCEDIGTLKVGDNLLLSATYNTSQHALNRATGHHHGSGQSDNKYEPIMGIALIYVADETH